MRKPPFGTAALFAGSSGGSAGVNYGTSAATMIAASGPAAALAVS